MVLMSGAGEASEKEKLHEEQEDKSYEAEAAIGRAHAMTPAYAAHVPKQPPGAGQKIAHAVQSQYMI